MNTEKFINFIKYLLYSVRPEGVCEPIRGKRTSYWCSYPSTHAYAFHRDERSLMLVILISSFSSLQADEFSVIAEKQNMLDHEISHVWSREKFPIRIDISGYVKAEAIYDAVKI